MQSWPGRRFVAAPEPAPSRFPRSVFDHGEEPDPRLTLANERTFLAWVRTALALIAGGVALAALEVPLHPGARLAASLVLTGLGLLVPLAAWRHWARVERAMRLGLPLPSPRLAPPLAVGVLLVAVLVVAGVVLRAGG
ncbi:YidH family protein [Actinotalea sp. M2MS4P-6]|uniref:YidH family protein n=1 Tax=Actinotalea sp. M2MS4P-6 TaxID=2983762 RepID=UPI0021E4D31E|nr:DUF202 domain-containing protein [Actinotalea sp. M2MS4P-6]